VIPTTFPRILWFRLYLPHLPGFSIPACALSVKDYRRQYKGEREFCQGLGDFFGEWQKEGQKWGREMGRWGRDAGRGGTK